MEKIYITNAYTTKHHNGLAFIAIHNTFSEFVENEIRKGEQSKVEDIIQQYINNYPVEDIYSEHLLVTARRIIGNYIRVRGSSPEQLAKFVTQPHVLRSASAKPEELRARKFLIARLLGELGENESAYGLFEEIAVAAKMIPPAGATFWFRLARAFQALLRQNQGLFAEAKELLKEVQTPPITYGEKSQLDCYADHVILKHLGTLQRRLFLTENASSRRRISHKKAPTSFDNIGIKQLSMSIKLLNDAKNIYDTHFVEFSLGYLYYLCGDNEKALNHFNNCLELLGPYQEEYYLVHIKILLAKMNLDSDVEEIQTHLKIYKKSLDNYPNYKSRINIYLFSLVENGLCGNFSDDEKVASCIKTREDLICVRRDVTTVLSYFLKKELVSQTIIDQVGKELAVIELRQNNVFDSLALISTITMTDVALGVCFDIRNFTNTFAHDRSKANKTLAMLRDTVRRYLVSDFDAVNYTGDGYIFVKSMDKMSDDEKRRRFQDIVRNCRAIISAMNSTKIGIGISFGDVVYFLDQDSSNMRYFIGTAANNAARMCDFAKPSGIVINANSLSTNIGEIETLELPVSFRRIEQADKTGSVYQTFASAETTEGRLLSRAPSMFERRFFVNFGTSCHRKCLYCINETIHTNAPHTHEETQKNVLVNFKKELEHQAQLVKIDDYLFSLGHLNESLDPGNCTLALDIVKHILDSTRSYIQLATKADHNAIKDFLYKLDEHCRGDMEKLTRLHLFYSISSITYAEALENRDPETVRQDLKELANLPKQFIIIPYVKPFLPGFTDMPSELLNALKPFPIVTVGYPYLSKKLLDRLAEYCLNNGLQEIAKHYQSYSLSQGASTTHPSYINRFSIPQNFRDSMESFVETLTDKNVFTSSPCASAYLANRTSFTQVGSETHCGKVFKKLFCKGNNYTKKLCPNRKCLYNAMFNQESLDELILEIIRNENFTILDGSHDIDHLERVRNLALKILEAYKGDSGVGGSLSNKAGQDQATLANSPDVERKLRAACLVHELGDRKIQGPSSIDEQDTRSEKALNMLKNARSYRAQGLSDDFIEAIAKIVSNASYDDFIKQRSNRFEGWPEEDVLVARILEDADRIDALGAIGIARCFAFKKNLGLFNIYERPRTYKGQADFKIYTSSLIHFFEKLLGLYHLLSDKGKSLAIVHRDRTLNFAKNFLEEYKTSYYPGSPELERIDDLIMLADRLSVNAKKLEDGHQSFVDLRDIESDN